MLAPCATCCVRKGAPERGGARRRCLPFLASFGLRKFGLLQDSNDGWKVPSARAAIYARRGAALGPRCTDCARTSGAIFFGCKTRDESGGGKDGRRRPQTPFGFRTKGGVIDSEFLSFVSFPSPKAKAAGGFHAERASIAVSHVIQIVSR